VCIGHMLPVGFHGSEPGLPWTTNPPSSVVRWARNAGLETYILTYLHTYLFTYLLTHLLTVD